MSNVVCLMNVEADRATFTWSEGPASFEPYTLDGMVYKDFQEIAAEAREKLADLVKDYLFNEQGMPKSAFELAEAGHEMYQAMFQPGADQARQAKQVRKWLEQLAQQHKVDTLEIVVESPWSLPWNIIYDQEPDKEAFLSGDENPDRWLPFWGLRYNLAGGRKVDPLRRMPLLKEPKVLLVVDPEIRDGLPEEQQQRLADFAETHKYKMVHSKDELQKAIASVRPELLYWLSHASADALVLAGEEISPRNMRKLLRQDDDENFGGMAFLNACQTAEGGASGSFFEAFHNVGFAGMIGTEHQTVDQFANPLGLDFLEAFLDRGEPVGSVLRKLRGRVPLGLLYGTYCPPDIRVDRGNIRDSLDIRQVHVQGVALSAGLAEDETVTRTLPPLPREPYRSLAYYDREDRALFAGRDDDIERFATYLDDAATRILVLHGESGVGKSSFLHAGVIPYLEEECLGYRFIRDWQADESADAQGSVIFIRATNDLFGQLAQALCEFCARPYEYQTPLGDPVSADLPGALGELLGDEVHQAVVRALLRSDPSLLGRIMSAVSNCLPYTAILVIDQGEEVFTLAQTPEDQQRGRLALDMLRRTVGATGDFKVIFCLRTEYYGRVIDRLRRGLHDAGSIREYLLTDFDEQALIEAIRRPTADEAIPYTSDVPFEKYNFRYGEGVAEEIAQRVVRYTTQRRDSVLPLVQVICAQLHRLASQRDDSTITLADLEKLGGIEGGMRSHVEGLLGELLQGRPLDKRPVQKLFTQLYLKQPDGTLTTALLPEDEVQKRWTGRMAFDELLCSSLTMRLLKVNTLRIGMEEERRYVSLGHDALAKLAAVWDEELTRSERVRKTLKKIAVWMSAAAVLLVLVGSVSAWMLAKQRAKGLVQQIITATPAELPKLIEDELPKYRRWTDSKFQEIADDKNANPAKRLRASLALVVPEDSSQVDWLSERMLDCHIDEFPVIRDSLKPYQTLLTEDLWQTLHDTSVSGDGRFRAGLALATYGTTSDQWTDDDRRFLAEHLVTSNPEHQPRLRQYLRPLATELLPELERLFAGAELPESQQFGAANALAEFAGDDGRRVARLLSQATPAQYKILFPLIAGPQQQPASEVLRELVAQKPADDLSQEERLALGRRRAGAAITLLRQGEGERMFVALRVVDDPESLTQFMHRCRQREVRPAELLECLWLADKLRQGKAGAERQIEDRVLFGLLLALGEFQPDELPADEGEPLVEQLVDWYASDPSSTVHGASGWLLRHWKYGERADKVDQTPVSYEPGREWFTLEIKCKKEAESAGHEQSFFLTFVVVPPGRYEIGSPQSELDRESDETRHPVRLTHPFAILDREVTREEYEAFDDSLSVEEISATPQHAMCATTWYDAVGFCRWLTERAGLDEADQAYADPETLDKQEFPPDPVPDAEGAPLNWPLDLDRGGFRLPTEAEWEIACRGGMRTAYSFGHDVALLDRYGWFTDNSDKQAHVPRVQRPNLRGLFDVHGNAYEWCHDWGEGYEAEDRDDPMGPPQGSLRVYRGGSWHSGAGVCRSAIRFWYLPSDRSSYLGFRVALVPSAGSSSK